ncbi:type IV pilus assembly protein PilM [Patescibacteria group bacterium]|nr:type IV pilus assembly protein PilM [Patescibacteria group bacterium]
MPEISFFKNLSLPSSFLQLRRKSGSVLGIDIGSSSIKIVQLRQEKERAVLETYGELATGPYGGTSVGKAAKLTEEKTKEALTDLIREAGAKAKNAVVAIPLKSSFVTVIEMPVMSERELKEAIEFEARRHIPVPLSEVVLDWWVIPEGFSGKKEDTTEEGVGKKKKFMSVLLAAIHKEVMDAHRSFITATGLSVRAFEIEIFSAFRALMENDLSPLLFLDFGAAATKVTVIDYGIVRMSYAYGRGSQDLSDVLSRSLGIDFARAEEIKRSIGLSDRPEHQEIKSTIDPILDNIISEIGRVLMDYRRKSGRSITRIIIYGGGGMLKGLVEKLAAHFGIEVNLAQPFNRLTYPPLIQPVISEIGPPFVTAIGLALRGLK